MEANRKEQMEALEALKEYNIKMVKALEEVLEELKGNRKEDTDEYLNQILQGINWELQVINGTMEALNEQEEQISKTELNQMIQQVNEAYQEKNNEKMALVIEEQLHPFFKELNQKIQKVC
ncbi:MAG: molecular chaperone [Lachnospiraceae bacterium]